MELAQNGGYYSPLAPAALVKLLGGALSARAESSSFFSYAKLRGVPSRTRSLDACA
jgi:hypothetical protein